MNADVTLRLDPNSPVPAYRQIVDGLRLLLVDGRLQPGDTLPTVRSLALDLGVHFSTVAEAYRTLGEEGWLTLKRRHGATVMERERRAPAPSTAINFSARLRQLVAQVRADGLPIRSIGSELLRVAKEIER